MCLMLPCWSGIEMREFKSSLAAMKDSAFCFSIDHGASFFLLNLSQPLDISLYRFHFNTTAALRLSPPEQQQLQQEEEEETKTTTTTTNQLLAPSPSA